MRARRIASLLIPLVMVAACSDGGADPFGKPPATTNGVTPDGTANWTLLVYMAADNNLEIDAIDDIREMQAGVSDDVNLLVLVDRAAADDTEGGHTGDPIDGIGSFAGVRLLHVTPDGIDDLNVRGDASGNADMTAPPILEQAGQMVFSQYPAEHTGVVFWDHGGGWKGFAVDESARSNLMTIDEISTSLQTIAAGAGIDKFSLVSFDACLMAELSVATAVAPVADYLLASEEVVPNHGMDYSVLADAVSGDPVQFGSVMIDGFEAQSAAKGDLASVTMSLLDLSRIDAVNAAIGEMQAAVGADQAGSVEFLRAVDGATAFAYQPDPTQSEHLRDLGQIAAILGAGGTSLAQPAAAIESAVRSAVVDHMEGEGYTGSYGLSVYAPLSIEHFKTSFTDVSSSVIWADLLDTVYGAGSDFVGVTDTSFVGDPAASYADGTLSIAARVSPEAAATIASVTVFYGAFVPAQDGFPDLILQLGRVDGVMVDEVGGIVGGSVPVLQLGISADAGSSGLLGVFSPVPSTEGSQVVLSVPVKYMPPGVSVDAGVDGYVLLTLDDQGMVAGRALFLYAENGTLGQVTPDPAGTIQTVVLQIGKDGSVVQVPSELYTDPPSLPATLDAYSIVVANRAPGDGSPLGDSLGFGVVIVDSGGTEHITFAQYTG